MPVISFCLPALSSVNNLITILVLGLPKPTEKPSLEMEWISVLAVTLLCQAIISVKTCE